MDCRSKLIPYKKTWNNKFKDIYFDQNSWGMIHNGWANACEDFFPFSGNGKVNFLTFFESHFAWFQQDLFSKNQKRIIDSFPKEPFVAIIHDPLDAYLYIDKVKPYPDFVLEIISKHCLGLYFMSNAEKYKFETLFTSHGINVPCETLYHPIQYLQRAFNLNKFTKQKEKQIYCSGLHLRNPSDLLNLPTPKNYKRNIIPWNTQNKKNYKQFDTNKELDLINKVEELSSEDYAKLYEDNIFFLSLFDCVANNTVLDCIDCCTPILINKQASIVEYLGDNYPLYFSSLTEAYSLLKQSQKITQAHEYLKNQRQMAIERGSLLKQMQFSEIYKSL
tara:strand:+ start:3387 stop:4385 length:999 start_codon:yes stop_codon:yes gene_type:complete